MKIDSTRYKKIFRVKFRVMAFRIIPLSVCVLFAHVCACMRACVYVQYAAAAATAAVY